MIRIVSEQEVVNDPTLARAIGFYNIYHQIWALIEHERPLMHCRNTTFIYHNDLDKYMKVQGAAS